MGEDSQLRVVHFRQLWGIDLWSLDDFDLSDLYVLHWVNVRDLLSDLLLNSLWSEQLQNVSCVWLGHFLGNDLVDLSSDGLLLGWLGVVSLGLLTGWLSGEGNSEGSQDITILGLNILDGFDEGFSLLDQWAELVSGHVNTVEWSEGLSSFSGIHDELNFSPMERILVWGKIRLHLRNNSAFNAVFDLFWNYGNMYLDLGSCWRMWSQMIQIGRERVPSIRTITFLTLGQRFSSFVPFYRSFSYSFLEPLMNGDYKKFINFKK